MKLKDLKFKDEFYWKGTRYKQLIRPINQPGKFTIICTVSTGEGGWLEMPAGRNVKPIIRIEQ